DHGGRAGWHPRSGPLDSARRRHAQQRRGNACCKERSDPTCSTVTFHCLSSHHARHGIANGRNRRNEPLIDLETQALAAEKAITRYVKRYADTLAHAGWSSRDAIWVEVKRLLDAVRDEVLRGNKARPH